MESNTEIVEIWKEVECYPNYCVSNLGRVMNVRTGLVLKQQQTGSDYLRVTFYLSGSKPNKKYVHRLVAFAFCEKMKEHVEVDHIDRNKYNNAASNLRWASCSENRQNTIKKKKKDGYSSQYKGVSNKYIKKWAARIIYRNKYIHLGYYDSEEEAAVAYNIAATSLFKEFAALNEIKTDLTNDEEFKDKILRKIIKYNVL